MRWCVLTLAVLVAASLFLTWRHPARAALGGRLAEALEAQGSGHLRGAIQTIEYLPDAETVAGVEALSVRRGVGDWPGSQLESRPDRFWAQHDADAGGGVVRFGWETLPSAREPLREVFGPSQAVDAVHRALQTAGLSAGEIEIALAQSRTLIATISDEQLLNQCLRADCALLEKREDPAQAACEALLLLALPAETPVLLFRARKGKNPRDIKTVYGITLAERPGVTAATLEMRGYDAHEKLAWRGVLEVDGNEKNAPDAVTVRRWALRMAGEAAADPPLDDSNPTAPAPLEFFHQ